MVQSFPLRSFMMLILEHIKASVDYDAQCD